MKLVLASVLIPVALFANAIEKTAPPTGQPRVEKRSASERWADFEKAESPSFRRHVIPLMSRSGCSGRECHGAFSGQGGFQLSLFGYDFEKDHAEITADKEDGVRVDTENPLKSLILAKPSLDDGETHKGKKVWGKGSWEYNLVRKWIASGAKEDVAQTGEFDRLELSPRELVFKRPGETVQLKVTAFWKDGTVEDVTQLTRFRTNDESVADVSATGLVTCKEKGDTHVVAFYDNGVEPVPAMLPVSTAKYPAVAARTKVDALVLEKLRKSGIVPSELCDDDDFLRRASLDVTGTLPAPAEIEAFLADRSPDKRARKIEELLARPGYAAWWTTKLCDFTGNNPRQVRNVIQGGGRNLSGDISRQWYDWIYERVARNEPYDKLAAGIVLATSRTKPDQSFEEMARELGGYFKKENPAPFAQRANMPWFWARQTFQKAEDKAMAFAHTFLGVRIECAQCHKHPFDQWTKRDFEQFQAFFAPVVFSDRRDDAGMSARSLRKDIDEAVKEKTAAEVAFQQERNITAATGATGLAMFLTGAQDGLTLVATAAEERRKQVKKAADFEQGKQRRQQAETDRRIATGEPVPWTELYVDARRQAERPREKKEVQGASRVITPKLLGGEEVMLATFPDPRQPLMEWLRARENPYFARAFVNRVWAGYFHRGIVEPADDLNLANAPTNGPLLDYLTETFVAKGYDMRWLHREILNSDTYQRSWRTNATNKHDEKNFSHAVIRRLPAEVVVDALEMATATPENATKLPTDVTTRAIGPLGLVAQQGGGGKQTEGYTLNIFGRPARETNCDCERITDPTLLQTIFTRNDQFVLRRIDDGWIGQLRKAAGQKRDDDTKDKRERIAKMKEKFAAVKPPVKPANATPEQAEEFENDLRRHEAKVKDFAERVAKLEKEIPPAPAAPEPQFDVEKIVREIFLRTVSRPPTSSETTQAKEDIAAAKTPVEGVRDLLWALINTREFMVNR